MCLVKKIISLSLVILTLTANAKPSYELVETCRFGKSMNENIWFETISTDSGKFLNAPINTCKQVYGFTFKYDGKDLGTLLCDGVSFLIVNGEKLKLSDSVNYSIDPKIKPLGIESVGSEWVKINEFDKSYICIRSPLSVTGSNAAYYQYYIIENAFTSSNKMISNFYFFGFDKNKG